MRPAVLLSISLALAAGVGCGRSAGPPPAVELDLQGHRGLEQRDGGWTRVFRSGEAPVLLVRPGADESGSLRLTGWIATTGGDAAWSLGDPAPPTDHGFDEIDGVLRAVIPADELGLADDLDATLVLVALRGARTWST